MKVFWWTSWVVHQHGLRAQLEPIHDLLWWILWSLYQVIQFHFAWLLFLGGKGQLQDELDLSGLSRQWCPNRRAREKLEMIIGGMYTDIEMGTIINGNLVRNDKMCEVTGSSPIYRWTVKPQRQWTGLGSDNSQRWVIVFYWNR